VFDHAWARQYRATFSSSGGGVSGRSSLLTELHQGRVAGSIVVDGSSSSGGGGSGGGGSGGGDSGDSGGGGPSDSLLPHGSGLVLPSHGGLLLWRDEGDGIGGGDDDEHDDDDADDEPRASGRAQSIALRARGPRAHASSEDERRRVARRCVGRSRGRRRRPTMWRRRGAVWWLAARSR
ncbi:MAG: hypothetical protein VX152_11915, partial [Pseudomonadota bacterium]|nr:hypothetical protein [Pseudomonadota bacterium]